MDQPLHPDSVYRLVAKYGEEVGILEAVYGFRTYSLRATTVTSALEHGSNIARVQEKLGHANMFTTRLYDKRRSMPEDCPSLRVKHSAYWQ